VGQGYDDIIPFDPDKFIGSLFGGVTEVSVENLKSTAKEPELVIEKHELDEAVKLKGKEEKEELLPLPKSSVRQSSPSVSIFAPKTEQNTEPNLPKSVTHQPEPLQDEEQPKEKKKSRFGLFGRKRTNDDRSKGEEEDKREKKQRLEEKQSTEEDRDKHRDEEGVEEGYIVDKQMQKEKRGQQDEDKIVYLTDEDIEDLLK
jgi:hypothetical protein